MVNLRLQLPEGFSRRRPQPGYRSGYDQAYPVAILGLRRCTARATRKTQKHGGRGFAGDREHRQPPQVAQARPHAEDHPHDLESKAVQGAYRDRWRAAGVRVPAAAGPCGQAYAPGPFAAPGYFPPRPGQAPPCQGPTPPARSQPRPPTLPGARCGRPAAQCPAPTAAWVTTGATGDTHSSVPEGLAPSRRSIKATRRNWALLSSRAIPALSPRRRGCAKLPGCRYPDLAARRDQGGADAQIRPHPR